MSIALTLLLFWRGVPCIADLKTNDTNLQLRFQDKSQLTFGSTNHHTTFVEHEAGHSRGG
ncbi:hypothetical protein EMIT0P4_110091 [Pseudomonas sp. IT-P4]